jgi:undecaprenyl-diphosphatase
LPAIVIGGLAHKFIKALYSPSLIGVTLILGGIILLLLEKKFKDQKIETVDDIPVRTAFLIGCVQVLALVPGVSRSGATIMGALALGLKRPAAAEFSFFLAVPVIAAAVTYDLFRNWDALMEYHRFDLLLAGFAAAFVTALAVLKLAMHLIARWGFVPFAWYRIGAGILVLIIFAG